MAVAVPDVVVHYHLSDRRPFANLSDLDGADLAAVIDGLTRRYRSGETRRVFGPRYMDMRRRTEEKMRRLFIEAGGRPERTAPHYFVLGACRWFRGLAQDTREVIVPLGSLPSPVTSFTYPDSFTAMGFGPDFGLPHEPRPYHDQVFRIEALADVIGRHGLPADHDDTDYAGYERRPFEKYIEVQLWSDAPLAHLLG